MGRVLAIKEDWGMVPIPINKNACQSEAGVGGGLDVGGVGVDATHTRDTRVDIVFCCSEEIVCQAWWRWRVIKVTITCVSCPVCLTWMPWAVV